MPLSAKLIVGLAGSFVFAVRMPLKVVSASGEKVTFKGKLPPAGTLKVVDVETKWELLLAMLVSCSVWPPVFWTVRVWVEDVPTRTVPNARAVGETTAVGGVSTPVPVSRTVIVGLAGSLVFIVRLALKVITEFGVKVMFKDALPPGGTLSEVGEGIKRGLELVMPDTINVCPPLFWKVSGREDDVPTVTLPNDRLDATTAAGGVGGT